MNLSEDTVEILRNFALISNQLKVIPGNVLRTVSEQSWIFAEAILDEKFPVEFAVGDLTKTLSLLSINKNNPEVDFVDDGMVFPALSGSMKIKQRFADEGDFKDNIRKVYTKKIGPKTYDVTFTLNQTAHKLIRKCSIHSRMPPYCH